MLCLENNEKMFSMCQIFNILIYLMLWENSANSNMVVYFMMALYVFVMLFANAVKITISYLQVVLLCTMFG